VEAGPPGHTSGMIAIIQEPTNKFLFAFPCFVP